MRAWIAVDHDKFTEQHLKSVIGKIGTLIVSANKKQISITL